MFDAILLALCDTIWTPNSSAFVVDNGSISFEEHVKKVAIKKEVHKLSIYVIYFFANLTFDAWEVHTWGLTIVILFFIDPKIIIFLPSSMVLPPYAKGVG